MYITSDERWMLEGIACFESMEETHIEQLIQRASDEVDELVNNIHINL